MHSLIAWNPVNLLDVEAKWLVTEVLVLLGALLLSKLLGFVLRVIDRRVRASWFHILAESVYAPCVFLLWFFVSLFSIDLVTDDLFRDNYPRAFSALVNGVSVLSLGWFLVKLKNGLITHLAAIRNDENALDAPTLLAISKILSIVIALFVIVLLHDATGMSLTTFLAFGGVGGLALAFASQEIFSNFFGGLMVHITRPFTVGERVLLPTHSIDGVIEEIGWYQTCVRALSKDAVYIPNSLFSKALLVNKSRSTNRIVDDVLSFSVYPLAATTTIIQEATQYLRAHPRVDTSEWAGVRIESFDGPICCLNIQAVLDTTSLEEYYAIRDEILLHIGNLISARGGILSTTRQAF